MALLTAITAPDVVSVSLAEHELVHAKYAAVHDALLEIVQLHDDKQFVSAREQAAWQRAKALLEETT